MGRARNAYLGAAVALLGALASMLSPLLAVALSFVGVVVALFGAMRLAVPLARWSFDAACLCHAAAVTVATGEPLLGAAAVLPLFTVLRGETLIGIGYKGTYAMPVLLAASVALTAWRWPGWWGASVVPGLVLSAYGSYRLVGKVMGKLRVAAGKGWAIAIGDEAPDFELTIGSGETFRLSEERGRFVLLMFLSSEWCPLCHVKMRVYQRARTQLEHAGVKVVAVWGSPAEVSEQFVRELGLAYVLLSDVECRAASLYGAIQQNPSAGGPLAPRPSFFLIGPDGRVRLTSRADDIDSYLDPDEALRVVLEATDAHPAAA